ncbi:MAG: branched chain amino acid aminotransferase, partial [Dehalococcoidia bacterium]
IPPQLKIMGHYAGNALAKSDAVEKGFDEAIMLNQDGYVAQGSGENIFLVINGKLVTPPTWNNILPGITRDCVITLARNELGIETIERPVYRAELFIADEIFLTGTAAHVTPVAEVDHRQVGDGEIGEITGQLQQIYADVIRGENSQYLDWCTPVYKK